MSQRQRATGTGERDKITHGAVEELVWQELDNEGALWLRLPPLPPLQARRGNGGLLGLDLFCCRDNRRLLRSPGPDAGHPPASPGPRKGRGEAAHLGGRCPLPTSSPTSSASFPPFHVVPRRPPRGLPPRAPAAAEQGPRRAQQPRRTPASLHRRLQRLPLSSSSSSSSSSVVLELTFRIDESVSNTPFVPPPVLQPGLSVEQIEQASPDFPANFPRESLLFSVKKFRSGRANYDTI